MIYYVEDDDSFRELVVLSIYSEETRRIRKHNCI